MANIPAGVDIVGNEVPIRATSRGQLQVKPATVEELLADILDVQRKIMVGIAIMADVDVDDLDPDNAVLPRTSGRSERP